MTSRAVGVVVGIIAAIALIIVFTGVSTISTPPDEVALFYKAGPLSSQKFDSCVPTSTRQWGGIYDKYVTLPASQRNYVADGTDDSDLRDQQGRPDVFTVVSKDGVEMQAPANVQFLLNTSCSPMKVGDKEYKGGVVQMFWELYGKRYGADFQDADDDTGYPRGWLTILNIFVGKQLDTAMDRAAQQYTWRQLYNDPTIKTKWEQEVNENLDSLVNRAMAGDIDFFTNYSVTIAKPVPPKGLRDAIVGEQTAVAKANAATAKADAQVAQARAETTVAEEKAKQQAAIISGYGGIDGYLKSLAVQKGLNIYQPSYGSAIVGR